MVYQHSRGMVKHTRKICRNRTLRNCSVLIFHEYKFLHNSGTYKSWMLTKEEALTQGLNRSQGLKW